MTLASVVTLGDTCKVMMRFLDSCCWVNHRNSTLNIQEKYIDTPSYMLNDSNVLNGTDLVCGTYCYSAMQKIYLKYLLCRIGLFQNNIY